MDEYYCPNCNTTLNDQDGFDPEQGTWTCTACGQRLMDDDVYNGDTFEGVAWRCDQCNALLNRQFGFSDSYGTWVCTECGHTNGTTEEDILDDDKIVRCPSCDGVLNSQSGFSEYDYDWECTYCGNRLHRDYSSDDFEVVDDSLICPSCRACLLSQSGFSQYTDEWTCTECGSNLHRDYTSSPFEVAEEEKKNLLECPNCGDSLEDQDDFDESEDDWICASCGSHLHRDYDDEAYEIIYDDDSEEDESYSDNENNECEYTSQQTYSPRYNTRSDSRNSTRNTSAGRRYSRTGRRIWRFINRMIITPIILLAVCSFAHCLYEEYKPIEIGLASNSLVGQNYEIVTDILEAKGFENVHVRPLKDLALNEEELVGTVQEVHAGGNTAFVASSTFRKDVEIMIYYHSLKLVSPPMDDKTAKGLNYEDVQNQFEEAGFINVKIQVVYDLIFAWFHKDGEIESVTIDFQPSFGQYDEYRPDAEVIITYHTFKKNEK